MSFKVLLDTGDGPEVVFEVDDKRVTRVSVAGSRGEVAAAAIPIEQTEILITLKYAHQDGRPTIFDAESAVKATLDGEQVQGNIDRLAELSSVTNQGPDRIMNSVAAGEQPAAEESDVEEGGGTQDGDSGSSAPSFTGVSTD